MPVAVSIQRTEFDRGSEVILCARDGEPVDLSLADEVQIEYIIKKESTFYVIGTDDEATFDSDGKDGKVNYNPPSGGWTKNCSLVVWAIKSSVQVRYPAVGEIEVRILHPGSAAPS